MMVGVVGIGGYAFYRMVRGPGNPAPVPVAANAVIANAAAPFKRVRLSPAGNSPTGAPRQIALKVGDILDIDGTPATSQDLSAATPPPGKFLLADGSRFTAIQSNGGTSFKTNAPGSESIAFTDSDNDVVVVTIS